MTISFSKAVIIPACWLNGEKIKIGVSILKMVWSFLQTNVFSPLYYIYLLLAKGMALYLLRLWPFGGTCSGVLERKIIHVDCLYILILSPLTFVGKGCSL